MRYIYNINAMYTYGRKCFIGMLLYCSIYFSIIKNVSSSTSHRKNSETMKLRKCETPELILAFIFLAHSFMNRF